jgi:hypothetical protein
VVFGLFLHNMVQFCTLLYKQNYLLRTFSYVFNWYTVPQLQISNKTKKATGEILSRALISTAAHIDGLLHFLLRA